MKKTIDVVILTPINSFYKVNLFNEVAKDTALFVIYTGSKSGKRSDDFYKSDMYYDNMFLPDNSIKSFIRILSVIKQYQCKKIILTGWDYIWTLFLLNLITFKKVGCIVESSVNESATTGIKAWVKKLILNKTDIVFASGELQEKLVRKLGYNGVVLKYGGCGILNYQPQPKFKPRIFVKHFLYVGRLSPEKNIDLIILVFNEMPQLELTIIGTGEDFNRYKSLSKPNIHFLGSIDNAKLPQYYQNSDCLLLPSKSEPWGLVVEEALNNGCPVIVSDMVGCSEDLVVNYNSGIIFESGNKTKLRDAIITMTDIEIYNKFRENVSKIDFKQRARMQVTVFAEF